jgi:large subunit ribosomal protein L4
MQMTLDVVNAENVVVGSVEMSDAVFAGRVNTDLIWESVVRQNASERRGTHMAKNRALVSGGGKKPYRQKGTGRAQVGSTRTPLWRHGGTVFGPRPRSYDYKLPKKVERGALRAALAARLHEGVVTVVEELRASEVKTKAAAELLRRLGAMGKTLVVDVAPDEKFHLSARNIAGVRVVASGRLTARDVMDTSRIIATRAAVERLQEVLA